MSFPVAQVDFDAVGREIVAKGGGVFTGYKAEFNELTLAADAARIVEALQLLRDHPDLKFRQLVDIAGVDYPQRERRFDVVYHLLSHAKNRRVRVNVQTDEDTPVPSVTSIFPNADWYEREAFDMYGIFFDGHPDLRRILTDYGFHGHPLRKDFPMSGYVEVRYDDELKRVVYEPIKMTEWRNWDFLSPWEGDERGYSPTALPGDEKAEAK